MKMVPFSGMITHDGTITFTHTNGRVYNVLPSNPAYKQVKEKLREVAADDENEALRLELFDLSQPKTIVQRSTAGRVTVVNHEVFYDGKAVKNFIAERIIWMITSGFDASPMLAFLEKVKENPSNRAVDELYRFMEANKMGLTKDGMILAYKRVRADWFDIYSNTIRNAIGDRPSMPRNEVDDDPTETCSHGLHVCAMSYLPSYRGAPGNHVVICSIHPKDVVAVPIEYHNAKMRVSEYLVIGEIEDQLDDILGRTPVWDEDRDDVWQDWPEEAADAAEPAVPVVDEFEGTIPAPVKPLDAILSEMKPISSPGFSFDVEGVRAIATRRAIGPVWGFETVYSPPKADFDFSAFATAIRDGVTEVMFNVLGSGVGLALKADPKTILADLNADELDVAKLVIALEKWFDLGHAAIGDDQITMNSTIDDVIGVVMALKA
jgi:acyl carrier protein